MSQDKSSKSKGKAAPAKKCDVFLVVSLAVSGRIPDNGNILSLGAVAISPARVILGTITINLHPLPGGERNSHTDVAGYWQSKREELELVSKGPLTPPAAAMAQLQGFCKQFGKVTLVGSPLLSVYGWLAHYWYTTMTSSMPWGFSGLCARSFASGALGVPMAELPNTAAYIAAHEGRQLTGYPLNDAIASAVAFTNILRMSNKDAPTPVIWSCPCPTTQFPSMSECLSSAPLPFREYPSITDPQLERSFAEKAKVAESDEWVATEKVHGSNFTIVCDGANIRCGKRTVLLEKSSAAAFFHYPRLVQDMEAKIRKCYQLAVAAHRGAQHDALSDAEGESAEVSVVVSIVGELAGGEYVHPAVPIDLRGIKVQNGVQYHPNNFFYAFDIALLVAGSDGGESEWEYLDFDTAQRIFDECGIFCAKPLRRGLMSDVLAFDPVFESTLPARFGLPLIPHNFAEGVVARPVHDVYIGSGAERSRVIAKLKHPAFSEFSHHSGDASPDDLLQRFALNSNRWAAVLSKLSADEKGVERGDAVAACIVDDALADVCKLHPSFDVGADARTALAAQVARHPEFLAVLEH